MTASGSLTSVSESLYVSRCNTTKTQGQSSFFTASLFFIWKCSFRNKPRPLSNCHPMAAARSPPRSPGWINPPWAFLHTHTAGHRSSSSSALPPQTQPGSGADQRSHHFGCYCNCFSVELSAKKKGKLYETGCLWRRNKTWSWRRN